jgi:ribosomal protein S12 methylthiotransferase
MKIGDLVGQEPRTENREPGALWASKEQRTKNSGPSTENGRSGAGAWSEFIPLSVVAQASSVAVAPSPAHPLTHSPDLRVPGAYADWRTAPIRRHASGPSAYLKISDGCNLRCAFCTIPSFKGDMRSKAIGAILGEAQELAAQGVREIILVAQHLTDYGRDLKLKDGLATLLDELCDLLPGDIWLRLMYAYPHGITPRLIETMARRSQICAYLDMPLQHAHPDTLRRMRRPPDTERTLGLIRDLRAALPDIALRSTFIVGFPGETREEFAALPAFLEQAQIDRVGVFRYSREPGTPAAGLPGQLRDQIIERRWHEVMRLQQGISLGRNRRWVGRTIRILVEGQGVADDGAPLVVGRSFRDAPEVDGQVCAWGAAVPGSFVTVRVTQALEYDLWGELV